MATTVREWPPWFVNAPSRPLRVCRSARTARSGPRAASQLLNRVDHVVNDLGHGPGPIDDRRATAFVDRSHPRIPPQGRRELFGMPTERVRGAGRESVAEGVLVDHQAHDEVEKIADVCLVLRRPAQERDAGTRLLGEALNALADDRPPISIELAPGHRIRGIHHDLAPGSVDPVTETVLVGVERNVPTLAQHPADRGLSTPGIARHPHQCHPASVDMTTPAGDAIA